MESGRNYHSGRGGWRGRGRGRGRGGGGRANYEDQGGRGRSYGRNQPSQGDGRGRAAPQHGYFQQPYSHPQRVNQPPEQSNQPASPHLPWIYRPPQTGRPWTPPPSTSTPTPTSTSTPPPSTSTPPVQRSLPLPQDTPQPFAGKLDISSPSSSSESKERPMQPIRRPDHGGTISIKKIGLLVNHFQVGFNEKNIIYHYDVDIKFLQGETATKVLSKSDSRFIKDLAFPGDELSNSAYDGEKSIFSAIRLREGNQFLVEVPQDEDVRRGTYVVSVKLANTLNLSRVQDYIRGNLFINPRDTLQGMDLVMKENPLRNRTILGRGFYSCNHASDLGHGLAVYEGFQQSLKPTSQGLSLCLDFSVLSLRQPLPVLEFLKQHINSFEGVNDVKRLRRDVERALKGLKVRVNHRHTNQKYTIAGLTQEDARNCYFEIIDPEGVNTPTPTGLLEYFKDKWETEVTYPDIPCLELGKNKKSNKVPMEFCVLVEGQRYPREDLERLENQNNSHKIGGEGAVLLLKNSTVVEPSERKKKINEMVQADDGPYGDIARNFGITLNQDMTRVSGRVIAPPEMRVGSGHSELVDQVRCQWNLVRKSFVDAKSLERWAMIDFTNGGLPQPTDFIHQLMDRCRQLGIQMAEHLEYRRTSMTELTSVDRLEKLIRNVMEKSSKKNKEKLQMIVCVMSRKDPGYKRLKWVSETQIGVATQCCLSKHIIHKRNFDQYLNNLCLKINAKLGGNNFELRDKFLPFDAGEHVMFIGADVNHPPPMNKSCPSIAAVVGSVNWPAANRYAARISPQTHRCEKIINFGGMCLELVETYAQLNKVRPARIVVFRDGVSEGQFEMVLAEEFLDLKKSIYDDHYEPPITVIVAQKRHQTRLFVEDEEDGCGKNKNVPPGTIVDEEIVHPHNFDFYLCSHFGGMGTSKATHYYVLWDENSFTSDGLQKLIYHMCFTFFRCTKPVSLVPPVYYADLAAYRGRLFQEAAMERRSGGPDESNFCRLHSELVDTMFFV